MSGDFRQMLRSVSSLGVLYVGSMAITFAIGVLLARMLGASDYGVYALAMTVATLAGMVTEFGLPILLMREVAASTATQDWGAARGLQKWADKVVIGIAALILAGFLTFYFLFDLGQGSAFLATMAWAILLIPIVAIGKLRGLALLSLGKTFAGQFPVLILRPGLFALALLFLFIAQRDVDAPLAMALQVGAAVIALVAVLSLFARHRPAGWQQAQPVHRPREWLVACIPMGMTEGLRLLQGQLAILLLGIFSTTATVGHYRVADAVASAATMGISVIATALSPVLARHWAAGDRSQMAKTQRFATLIMTGSSIALALPFLLFGSTLFPFIFGSDFAISAIIFPVIWASYAIVGLIGAPTMIANMTGKQNAVTVSMVINVVLGCLLSLPLGAQYGSVGIALAMLIGNAIGAGYLWYVVRTGHGIDTSILGLLKNKS